MKNILYLFVAVIAMACTTSCTKYDFVETGTANGIHNTTMWEYFKTDSYDWDSLMVMAQHAGLQDVFEGTSKYGKNLTFLGITNHSIRRYILDNGYNRVTDIPVEDCRRFILNSILDERIDMDSFLPGTASTDQSVSIIGTGGKKYTALSGKILWIYTFNDPYGGVPGAGPKRIHIVSEDAQKSTTVASSNIMTETGIVHSLEYSFNLTDF